MAPICCGSSSTGWKPSCDPVPDCPVCGNPNAYKGFSTKTVECPGEDCVNYSESWAAEVRVRKETSRRFVIDPDWDELAEED